MFLKLTYDQIPESEACDTFSSETDLLCFAIDQLHGNYHLVMNWFELELELEKNGYFVAVVD